jgi:GPH family glycoside/pentoside/hexuronide:cation symporter
MVDAQDSRLRMLGFATPALPLNALVTAVFVFIPALYSDQVGISAATVGVIFLLAKVIDVIITPLWGIVMDKYPTRWGRRRPWLVLSVPFLMLAVYMLFNPPDMVSSTYLIIWLVAIYIAWDAWTISHTAWALEMSGDYDQRSRITGLLQIMIMIGGVLVSVIPAVMERLWGSSYDVKITAISFFIMLMLPLTVILCLMSMPERPVAQTPPRIGFKKGLHIIFTNAALIRLLLTNALLTFSTYYVQGLFVYYVSYTLGLDNWVGFLLVFLLMGGLLCVPVWIKLSVTFSKHRAVQVAMLVGGIAPLLLLVLPADNVLLACLAFLIIGVNSSANEFLPRTMMADVCDHDNIQSGSERMGLYYSLLILSSKLAGGVGIFLGFSFLGVFGFDPDLGINNTQEALDRLRYLIVGLPVLAYAGVLVLMWRYPITRERQQEMRAVIEGRE